MINTLIVLWASQHYYLSWWSTTFLLSSSCAVFQANSKLEARLQRAKEAYRQAEDGRRAAVLELDALVKDVEGQAGSAAK